MAQDIDLISIDSLALSKVQPAGVMFDAFGRLRVSETVTLFDSVHTYGLNSFFWDQITSNSGSVSYTSNQNKATLSCTGSSGSRAVHQTHNYLRYQPAKSHYIKCTGVLGDGNLRVVKRSSVGGSVVDEKVSQDSFNIDKIDGSGDSGFNIDTTKANIFTIDFQYLGVGFIRFGAVSNKGELLTAHIWENANLNGGLYMSTAMLPFRTEIFNDGSSTFRRIGYFDDNDGLFFEVRTADEAASMDFFCCSIESESGQDKDQERGIPFSASTTDDGYDFDQFFSPVMAIRPKLNFKGKTNRGIIVPENLNVILEARFARIAVVLNPTTLTGTGASWSSVDDDSIVESWISTSGGSLAGGKVLREYMIDSSSALDLSENFLSKIGLSLDALGTTQDVLAIGIERLSSSSTAHVAMNWKELY